MEIPAQVIGRPLYSLTVYTLGVTVTVSTVILTGILEAIYVLIKYKLLEIPAQGMGHPLYSLTVHTLGITVTVTTVTLAGILEAIYVQIKLKLLEIPAASFVQSDSAYTSSHSASQYCYL